MGGTFCLIFFFAILASIYHYFGTDLKLGIDFWGTTSVQLGTCQSQIIDKFISIVFRTIFSLPPLFSFYPLLPFFPLSSPMDRQRSAIRQFSYCCIHIYISNLNINIFNFFLLSTFSLIFCDDFQFSVFSRPSVNGTVLQKAPYFGQLRCIL